MTLTRKLKIWLILISIPIVLIVAGAVTLKILFTGERLKAMVVPRLESALGRTVTIQSISLSVFPTVAIDIGGLSISNRKGEGFSDQPFVSLERLLLHVHLPSLIKGRVELTTAVLEQPSILVEINQQGLTNYGDLGGGPSPPAAGEPARGKERTSGGPGLLFSNVEIVNGSVRYVDRGENTLMTVQGLNHVMKFEFVPVANEARMEGQTSVDNFTYGTLETPLISNLHLTMDERLAYGKDQDSLLIQKGTLTVQDMALDVTGSVASVTATPYVNIAFASDRLNIADLLSVVPKEYMKKAEGLRGNGTAKARISIVGPISDSTKPAVTGTVSASDASLQYASLPMPITGITIEASFLRTKTHQTLDVDRLSASLGTNPITAAIHVVNFEDPAVKMSVNGSMNLVELKDFYPLEPGTDLAGKIAATVDIDGKVSDPATMRATGTLQFQNVTIRSAASPKPVENLQGTVSFHNERVESKGLSMNLGKSDLSAAFQLANYLPLLTGEKKGLPKPTATVTLTSRHLYTADLMSDAAPAKAGNEAPAGKTARSSTGAGLPLPGVEMNVAASIGALTMERLEFQNVRASAKIADEVLTLQNFAMDGFGGSASAQGTVDMKKPSRPLFDLSLDLNRMDARQILSKFTPFGEHLSGALTMKTALKGALDDTLGLIPSSLAGQGAVNVQGGKLTDVKVNQLVAGLLKLSDLQTVSFKDWTNSFSIADGRLVLKDLKINALDADYLVNGSMGLDGSLDYVLSLILPDKTSSRITVPGFAGQMLDLFKDETGRVRLDFTVGGTSTDPKVALNSRSAQQKAENLAKEKAAGEAKKLQDQVKKKEEELLKGLFKKK